MGDGGCLEGFCRQNKHLPSSARDLDQGLLLDASVLRESRQAWLGEIVCIVEG